MVLEKITINLEPEVDRAAVDRVRAAINELGAGGEITITIESADAHQADPVLEVLDESGFDYQSKGSHNGRSYYINARRKLQ
ncbi:MAG: hypothetical protein C4575_14830 [Desulforudis sp.]|nr:MAG: hypothetical protein C4575_14830 [Desulforudis sp.]